jgi:glycosyltransferase involved in cell wall biosynthesis
VEDLLLAAGVDGRRPSAPSARQRPGLISVVLPILDGEAHVAEQLGALAGQTYRGDWELVVVDNGCSDRSIEFVERFRDRVPPLVVADARRRRGLGRARNAGATAARGDLLAYCDADDVVAPVWLEALAEGATSADIVGGSCRYEVNSDVQLAWERPAPMTSLHDAYDFLPYPPGGNCAIWADVAREVGWDESFAYGASDIDFGWRAQLAGFRIAFEPRAVIQRRFRDRPSAVARQHFRSAMSEPYLHRRFRAHGMDRSDSRRALLAWCRLGLTSARLVTSTEGRGYWLRDAAVRSGRICGSVRHRNLYL